MTTICTALIVIAAIIGILLFVLEWRMPGFLMTTIQNGVNNGQAYRKKRAEIKAKGGKFSESFYDFSKGLGRTVSMKPPEIYIEDDGHMKKKKAKKS